MLDREALESAVTVLQNKSASTTSALFFRQFLQQNNLLNNSQEAQLKACCIMAYFVQLLKNPDDKKLTGYWGWGHSNNFDDAFLSAAINLGNDFLTEWYRKQSAAIAPIQQQPTQLQAATQLQQPQTQIQPTAVQQQQTAITQNGPDKVVHHSPSYENQGAEIVTVINQAIAANDVQFQLLKVEHGPRVTEYSIKQKVRNEDGSRPRLLPPEHLQKLSQTLRVYADAGSPAIFAGDGRIVVQVARKTFQPLLIEKYLNTSSNKKGYWQQRCDVPLSIPVGIGTDNKLVRFNLDSHALIGGSTGGGKTSLLDSILLHLIYNYSPELLRIALVDVQSINLSDYDGIPSLLGGKVLCTASDIEDAITHIYGEQLRREELLKQYRARDFLAYNRGITDRINKGSATTSDYLPFIVFVVDEQAEAAALLGKKYLDSLCQIARAYRKFGIHLILATQRPSKEASGSFPAELAANIPIRIALRTTDKVNSEIILGSGYGMAANLAGKGDGYLLSTEEPNPIRFQSFWADPETIVQPICQRFQGQRVGQYPETIKSSRNAAVELFPTMESPQQHSNPEYSGGYDDPIFAAIQGLVSTSVRDVKMTTVINHLTDLNLISGSWDKKKLIVMPYKKLWGGNED